MLLSTNSCIAALLVLPVDVIDAKAVWQTMREHHKTRPPTQDLKPAPEQFEIKELDYGGNHPFEVHERHLQGGTLGLEYDSSADFEPLRIKFLTDPLESLMGQSSAVNAKITAVLEEVLPAVKEAWTAHLSVVPVQSAIPIQREDCFGIYDDLIPSDILEDGVQDADLAIFVSGKDTLTTGNGQMVDVCGPGTLAVATSCVQDQFDRPVIGFINFCLPNLVRRLQEETDRVYPEVDLTGTLSVKSSTENILISREDITDSTLVATHEVGHVVGVDSDLFLFFRDPKTGEPLTPRPFQSATVRCIDGSTQTNRAFPASNTVQSEITSQGRMYYDLVTPRVRTVVRNHFNCQTLPGARLENQDTGQSCTGAHFDERLFYSELMGPIFSGTTDILSPLTLALLEDSGWYKVSYEGSEVSPFGHGAGCGFVNDDCIINDEVPSYAEGAFCSSVTQIGSDGRISGVDSDFLCDPTHRSIGVCDLFNRDEAQVGGIFEFDPDGIRYFSDSSLQALTAQNDWCPVASIPIGVDCTVMDGPQLPATYSGEEYGPNSRCVNFEADGVGRSVAGCFRVECDAANRQVVVNGEVCGSDGQRIEVPTVFGIVTSTMICPKLAVVCPQLFCQGGCSGRGVCNYDTNQCECFDTENSSPICAGSKSTGIQVSFPPTPASAPTPGSASAPTPGSTPTPTLFSGSSPTSSCLSLRATLSGVISVLIVAFLT